MLEDAGEDADGEAAVLAEEKGLSARKEQGVQVHSAQWKGAVEKESAHARTPVWQAAQRSVCLLLSEAARPVRFLCTGGIAALFQLGLLGTLVHQGWNSALADIAASLLGAQVNFMLSFLF